MTDLAAIGLAIEAIASLPVDYSREARRDAVRVLLAMRDTVPVLTESVDALIARIQCVGEERDQASRLLNEERERANEWLSLLHDLRGAIACAHDETNEDLQTVITRVDDALEKA